MAGEPAGGRGLTSGPSFSSAVEAGLNRVETRLEIGTMMLGDAWDIALHSRDEGVARITVLVGNGVEKSSNDEGLRPFACFGFDLNPLVLLLVQGNGDTRHGNLIRFVSPCIAMHHNSSSDREATFQ